MSPIKAVCPGTFDPLTLGHTDYILRAAEIFDHVIVGVLNNPDKSTLFSVEERLKIIEETFAAFSEKSAKEGQVKWIGAKRIEAKSFSGLLVDFAQKEACQVIVRGLRATSDYEYEAQMALMNRHLNPQVETLYLMTREKHSYISSSVVKQIASFGGDVSSLVPEASFRALQKRL